MQPSPLKGDRWRPHAGDPRPGPKGPGSFLAIDDRGYRQRQAAIMAAKQNNKTKKVVAVNDKGDGFARTIRAVGFNRTAAMTWAAASPTRRRGRSGAGRRSGGTFARFKETANRAMSPAGPGSATPVALGLRQQKDLTGSLPRHRVCQRVHQILPPPLPARA
jgi:hypothetical protein